MTTRIFTAPQVPGSGRSSTRILTHAIVASFNRQAYEADLVQRILQVDTRHEKGSFLDCMAVSLANHGERIACRNRPVTQAEIDLCAVKMRISGGNWGGWMEMIRIDRTATAHARMLRETDAPRVIHWSASYANAEKAQRMYRKPHHFYTDVQIVEVAMMRGK